MSNADYRQFQGLTFGFSISASNIETEDIEFGVEDVNHLTYHEACHVLREGGRIVLGHHWKAGGVMHHLACKAEEMRTWPTRRACVEDQSPIVSVIAWPDCPPSAADLEAQRMIRERIVEVERLAIAGPELSGIAPDSEFGVFCRIRSLTVMRRRITDLIDIRLCVGGGKNQPNRRLPGVVEEAILAIEAGKPLCVSSAQGGVSKLIADVMLQRKISDVGKSQFLTPELARNTLLKFQATYPFPQIEGPGFSENSSQENWSAYRYLSSVDLDRLAVNAGLSIDEYINLLTTASMNRALALFRKAARVVNDKRKNSPRIKSIEAIEAEEFVPPAKPR